MAKDLGLLVAGIIVGLAALIMGLSLKQSYQADLSFMPESPSRTSIPASTRHFFRPGSGIDVKPMMANSNN